MRTTPRACLAMVVCLLGGAGPAMAQVGTAFTYQGRLNDAGSPASGLYDLELKLWNAATTGSQVGATVTRSNVTVSSGLFTVMVDFGGGMFGGARRWLSIGVRPGGTAGAFTTLAPRQELTPVANAIFASSAATLNGLTCATGQVAKWIVTGWACGADTSSGGTMTSLTAGAGLSGGTITTAGTVAVATGGITSSMVAAGAIGAAQINTSQVQVRAATMCPGGQFLRGLNADGSIVCEDFDLPPTAATVDDPAGFGGTYTSIAVGADGLPVISYADETAHTLKVAKCVNSACTGGTIITVVDDPAVNRVGTYSSIAIGNDGFPVISYQDETAGRLLVAKCVNAACTGASTITVVDDPADIVGTDTSIAIGTDGFPVISYFDTTAGTLKVAKCVNAACTGTSTITTVDDPANLVGPYTSIAIGTDGFPVISFQDATASALKVAKCVNASCVGSSIITTVFDPAAEVGYFSSLKIGRDGFPVISFLNQTAHVLYVAKCADAACAAPATVTPVDDPANQVGEFSALAIGSDGLPIISYLDSTALTLKVAQCVTAACVGTSVITTVDDPVNQVGLYTSIAIGADGMPIISYLDLTAGALKVAKCHKASCAP
jgi:hypothetical protein